MATKQDINETKKILNDLTTNTILFFDDIQNAIKNAGVEISEDLSIDNWAQIVGTINYELPCRLKVRLPRVYTR